MYLERLMYRRFVTTEVIWNLNYKLTESAKVETMSKEAVIKPLNP
jgi:hypothetical protein